MGIVTPTNKEVLGFKGLHLYHSGVSNCAMRVRMTLEEKKLAWTSHHLDITKKEHVTAEYFGINPNGVVPTLVHDGVVIIESDDIIDYIDQTFPESPLRPESSEDLDEMYWWMKSAGAIHVKAVKTYIYYHKMQGKMKQSDQQRQAYEKLQTNKELVEFHNASSKGFSVADAKEAEQTLDHFFEKANTRLTHQDWLVGEQFTLADITWVPLHFTLSGVGYNFAQFPAVQAWANKLHARESFAKAILQWCPIF
ncbi:MAG: glutathione S-transferase family protein [Paraglaciecola polaris]|uniref:glutathione S-transferase family protein n=1 Tax=Paraglaciecola polaris TaxID=222814 RepID=UPI00300171D3|tara:strand:- start:3516 stop:4271 length:756 start_codon:yes stop_codon:yes gene_type:complete